MSNESDSDEYVDAQEATPIRIHRNSEKRRSTEPISPFQLKPNLDDEEATLESERLLIEKKKKEEEEKRKNEDELLEQKVRDFEQRKKDLEEKKDAEKRAQELEKRKKKLEMKRYLLEDDDYANTLPSSETSSLNSGEVFRREISDRDSVVSGETVSSVEGLASIMDRLESQTIPSKEISRSQESLGAVSGQQIIDVCDTSGAGEYRTKTDNMPEPDVVASTKGKPPDIDLPPPVAPPRRKRKGKILSSSTPPTTPVIPSPATTVENLTRELEESLDLKSAASGERVVKPQDLEPNKAEGPPPSESREGEENRGPDINPMMRTRSNSGRLLSDQEILESVMVLNLDTGEQIPLSLAEDRLPKCINPLSLHIMRLTSEYVSNSSLNKHRDSDGEGDGQKSNPSRDSLDSNMKKKGKRLKRLIGKTVEKTYNKIKHVADEVLHGEDSSSSDDELEARRTIKIKASSSHKGPYVYEQLRLVQDLKGDHTGAIWTMKFSHCGRLLASAGQDNQLRIWVLKDAYSYFDDMRQKYQTEVKVSPAPSQESLGSHHSAEEPAELGTSADPDAVEDSKAPFMSKPFCMYTGHTADLLDVSWSKNYFILSSSMDKTVRLWHISRKECLCCFQHIDFVTAIAFHPRDDRYFLSGSLDGKLRLWNIPDKKVALWNEVDGQTKLITAANFCQNGKFAVVGTYDGRCIFYNTEQLKYYTQIHCRSSRGRNAKGRKISGIEPMPGEDKVLVTSNDSRIRLYDLRDLSLTSKYKGCSNSSSQIKASFSHDGKYIVCGSEDRYVYVWKTYHDYSKFSSTRRDRNDFWESIKAHNALVTAAIFAPNPSLIFKQIEKEKTTIDENVAKTEKSKEAKIGEVLVTADFSGTIKVFINKPKSKLIPSQSATSMASTASTTS